MNSDLSTLMPGYEWRDGQREVASEIAESLVSGPRYTALHAPTGTGKSVVAIAAVMATGRQAVILTNTIQLQEQYERMADDGKLGPGFIGILKGKGNFECRMLRDRMPDAAPEDVTADLATVGECRKCPLRMGGCHYYDHMRAGVDADVVVTNYSKWILDQVMRDRVMESGRVVVMDEGDTLLDVASDAAGDLRFATVRRLVGMSPPDELLGYDAERERWNPSLDPDQWLRWVYDVSGQMKALAAELGGRDDLTDAERRDCRTASNAVRQINLLATDADSGLAVGIETRRNARGGEPMAVSLKPVTPRHAFYQRVGHEEATDILVMSASMPDESWYWSSYLGVAETDMRHIKIGSGFDPMLSPIRVLDGAQPQTQYARQRGGDEYLQAWASQIDAAAERHWANRPGANILMYARSGTDRREYLQRTRLPAERLIHYGDDSGLGRAEAIDMMQAGAGVMLVGTGVERGIDLAGDACDLIISGKLPRYSTQQGDLLKGRVRIHREYLSLLAAQDFTQLAGRATRSDTDRAEMLIADGDDAFWQRCERYFPDEIKARRAAGASLLDYIQSVDIVSDLLDEYPEVDQCRYCGRLFVPAREEHFCDHPGKY